MLNGSAAWNSINITGAASDIAIGGTGQLTLGAGGVDQSGANLSIACPLALSANQTWVVTGANMSISGVLSGSSGCVLTKLGSGMLTLSNSNSYGGLIALAGGTLGLANLNAVRNSTVVLNGAQLVFDSSVVGNAFSMGGLSAMASGSGYDIALQNNAASPGPVALTVGVNGSSSAYVGTLSGSGSLIKTGTGTLTLSGYNTFTGDVTVGGASSTSGGTLRIACGGALGIGPKTVWLTNPSNVNKFIDLDGSAGDIALASNILWVTSGNNTPSAALIRNLSGNNSIGGNVQMDTTNGGTYISSENGTLTLAGNISPRSTATSNRALTLGGSSTKLNLFSGILSDNGTKTASLTKADAGYWLLTGSNTFSGGTTVSSGTLALAGAGRLGSGNLTIATGAVCSFSGTTGALATTGTITLSGSGQLNFSTGVVERVSKLVVNGTSAAKGVWNAARDPVHFSGSGCLLVATPGLTAQQDWRSANFGTTANSGNAADLADPDADGFNNFLDYATGMSPLLPHASPATAIRTGTSFDYYFSRNHAAVIDGFTFAVEWSDTLVNDWSTTGVTQFLVPGSDNGFTEAVCASVPVPAGTSRRFVRLRVSIP